MNETQRNIKRYKAALPGLRERITATAMLLLVSLSMLVSTSLAWITLSIAPEVSAVATTVASNGNLEIALAHGDVKDDLKDREKPEEVALGDSTATQGQTLVGANITWGNLVNLSDNSYGMSHVSLRPATLTENNQSRTPLKGVDYTVDGRFIESDDYYRFASYDETYGSNGGFRAGEGQVQYGLRAISSMILSNDEEQSKINEMGEAVDEQMTATKNAYNVIIKSNSTDTGSYMNALTKMLEKFVNNKAEEVLYNNPDYASMVDFSPANYAENVDGLKKLLIAFRDALREESELIRQIINMHIFDITGEKTSFIPAGDEDAGENKGDPIRVIARSNASRKELQDLGVPKDLLDILKDHVADYDKIVEAINGIETNLDPMVKAGNTIYWDLSYKQYDDPNATKETDPPEKFLDYYISNLVNMGKTYVGPANNYPDYTSKLTGTKMKSIYTLASMSDALGVLGADIIEVEIGGGVLLSTEQRIGSLLYQNNLPYGTEVTIYVDPKTKGLGSVAIGALGIKGNHTAAVRTAAPVVALLDEQINVAKRLVPEPKNMVSKDIYGFAIDLWVRTNAHDTILTLEGMTEYEEVRGTCTDINGDTRELWTATGTVMEEVNGEMVEVPHVFDCYIINEPTYKLDENGEPVMNGDQPVMENVDHVYDALGHGIVGIWQEMNSEEGGYTFAPKMVKVYKGFHGENRVWQEMIDGGYVTADSTTQGAGSCYVFYASPTEQIKILEMLQSFTVAFLDGDDNLVATAKLNTAEAFAVNGKVTVPLVVVTGVAFDEQVEGSEESVSKKGIMEMPWGEATWLTAIVYLDGKDIGNDNVLAAGSIEGSLNLQFGSSVDINSQKNEPLLQKFRTVTAVLKGNGTEDDGSAEKPTIEFAYDKTTKKVVAELTITGDQPNNVTAFLTRVVGKNQGSRMETKTFTRDGSSNKWTAEFEITNPGEYRLNSVVADGVEYMLEKKPGVKITGQSTSVITCTPGSGSVMTSAGYYDIQLEMNINTASADLQPNSVSVMFSYGNGKTAVANMSPIGNGNWRGKLHVTESGNYVMTYLVMDGNEDEVNQETSVFVRVGLEAAVSCDGILGTDGKLMENLSRDPGLISIQYQQPEEGKAYTAKMQVKLYDGSGAEVKAMTGLRMSYSLDSNREHKIDGDLIWVNDADGGHYQIEMPFDEAGTYVFDSIVTDDSNTIGSITSAPDAMVFSAVPPEPPVLTENPNNTESYQYKPNANTATMSVKVYDAESAVVEAEIVNLVTGVSTWVTKPVHDSAKLSEGDHRTVDTFTFTIPKNGDVSGKSNTVDGKTVTYVDDCVGTQDGIWVLKNLRMQNVTNEDKELLPVDPNGEYLTFDMSGYNVRTEVMQSIYYSFVNQQGNEYRSQDITGGILESHAFTGVTFKISDWRGSTEHLRNVKLNVTHGGDSGDKGGYTINTAVADQVWLENSSAAENDLKDLKLQVAGTYSVSLSYGIVVDGTVVSSYGPKPTGLTFTVTSQIPTVTITAASNAGGTVEAHKDTVNTGGDHSTGVSVPQFTSTNATVYISCSETGTCTKTHTYTAPTVTIKLDGIGGADSAELIFTPADSNTDSNNKSTAYIYANGQHTGSYTWDGNNEVSRTIGSGSSGNKHAAETVIGKTLVLKGAGYECTFTLTENTQIVINNPF